MLPPRTREADVVAERNDPRNELERIRTEHQPNEHDDNCCKCGEPYACDAAWMADEALARLESRTRRPGVKPTDPSDPGPSEEGRNRNDHYWITN